VRSTGRALRIYEYLLAKNDRARHFDEASLVKPAMFAPAQIEQLRESNNASQPVFARYLNTRESTVEKWEAGTKKPSGTALKLLTVVQKHGLRVLAD
jgi:putative transcriptional regulator